MEQVAETQAVYWNGWLNGYIRVLRTLANIMANYEYMPAENRREYYNSMLFSLILSDTDIGILETVWKPNAIDGRDSHIGRYNTVFRRSFNLVENLVSAIDIDTTMAYLNGPNSREDRVDALIPYTLDARTTHLIRMTVPIINPKTDEVVGCVSLYLNMDMVQKRVEQFMTEYPNTFMIVYSDDGLILGSYKTDLVGRKMTDVENMFGSYAQEAERSVLEGMDFYLSTYSIIFKEDVYIFMKPVSIGNSDTAWSISITIPKSFLKQHGFVLW
jgi:methyl-accepting chemotaxis protein